jgi:hypothetical protein
MIGALSRTRPLLKPKGEVSMAMVKWWKKKRPQDAEVRNNKNRRSIDTFFHAASSNRRGRQTIGVSMGITMGIIDLNEWQNELKIWLLFFLSHDLCSFTSLLRFLDYDAPFPS